MMFFHNPGHVGKMNGRSPVCVDRTFKRSAGLNKAAFDDEKIVISPADAPGFKGDVDESVLAFKKVHCPESTRRVKSYR